VHQPAGLSTARHPTAERFAKLCVRSLGKPMELRLLLVATGRRPNTGSLGYRRDRGSVSRWRGTQLNGSENVDVRARVGQRFPIPDQRRTGQCRSAVRQDV